MTKINFRRKEENKVMQENVYSNQNEEKQVAVSGNAKEQMANCSAATPQGKLNRWKKFREAAKPIFEELCSEITTNTAPCHFINPTNGFDYRDKLEAELKTITEH